MKISLILPTIDEAENVRRLIPALLGELSALAEVIVVDDGSTDGTREIVRRLANEDSRVKLIARSGKACLTDALQEGIDAATGALVGWMDADCAMTPSDLESLRVAVSRGADMAVGSRFVAEGRMKGQSEDGLRGRLKALRALGDSEDSWIGVALSWALNGVVLPAVLFGGIHDYTSGFVLARRAVFEKIRLEGDHGEYFIHLWVQAERQGFRIDEVGYRVQARRYGRSKTANSLREWWRRGRAYLRAAVHARRDR
jgi:glycosyltransferase involved in cell wall biosynthesis